MLELLSQPVSISSIPEKLLFNRHEVVSLTGLSLRKIDSLIADGSLRVKRVGSRVFVSYWELMRFVGVEEHSNNRG